MKRILFLFFFISQFSLYSQISKTSGILYTNGNPKTNSIDSQIRQNLNKNSEIVIDQSTGDLYTYKRVDSTFNKFVSGDISVTNLLTLTLSQFQTAVTNATLEPGKVYKITGVHKNKPGFYIETLYDDGTNSGITIYLTALSSNTFTNSGYGEFYNPIYQPVDNYDNTDKTGLWGIWDTSVTYVAGDRTIWGGYMWESVAGGDGTSVSDFELSSEWEKLPYSDTSAYNKVIDYIEYDFDNDFITRRRDEVGAIDVEYKLRNAYIEEWDNYGHPIAIMQWGNYGETADIDIYYYPGTSHITVSGESIFNCINFKGKSNSLNKISGYSKIYDNVFNKKSQIINNTLTSNSAIYNNTLTSNSYIYNNTLTSNSAIYNNTLTSNSAIYNNTLTSNSAINFNTLTSNSAIYNNTLTSNSAINFNTLTSSTFNTAYSGTLSSKTIQKTDFDNIDTGGVDFSSATNIFQSYSKKLYTRADGTKRLLYYNNSDTPTIVNINN